MGLSFVFSIAFVAFIVYWGIVAVYQWYFSPLRTIPGPWLASLSPLWLPWHAIRLRLCYAVEECFQQYGPVVRVGPNKVFFRDGETMKDVYGNVYKLPKSDFYKVFGAYDAQPAISIQDHEEHAVRRKGFASHYTPANLALCQPQMHDSVLELLTVLDSINGETPVDCLVLFRHMMVDMNLVSLFSYSGTSLKSWAEGMRDPMSTAINDFSKCAILKGSVPRVLWWLISRYPSERWRQFCIPDKILADFVSDRLYETKEQLIAGTINDSERPTLLHRLLAYHVPPPNRMMTEHDVIVEAAAHLVASVDTTSTTLSYFFWELSRRSDIVQQLRVELNDALIDARSIPDISVLNQLPYLNAVVNEGLRLYSNVQDPLERVAPETSVNNDSNKENILRILGCPIPPGTVISTQAWSMHRTPSVFPSPNSFTPERWLNLRPEDELRLQAHFMPFGHGPRICVGHTLAQMILKIAIAAVVRNFDIRAPMETNEKSMEIRDIFVLFPAAGECKLFFIPRQD